MDDNFEWQQDGEQLCHSLRQAVLIEIGRHLPRHALSRWSQVSHNDKRDIHAMREVRIEAVTTSGCGAEDLGVF